MPSLVYTIICIWLSGKPDIGPIYTTWQHLTIQSLELQATHAGTASILYTSRAESLCESLQTGINKYHPRYMLLDKFREVSSSPFNNGLVIEVSKTGELHEHYCILLKSVSDSSANIQVYRAFQTSCILIKEYNNEPVKLNNDFDKQLTAFGDGRNKYTAIATQFLHRKPHKVVFFLFYSLIENSFILNTMNKYIP